MTFTNTHKAVYELLGTFILVSTICYVVTAGTSFKTGVTQDTAGNYNFSTYPTGHENAAGQPNAGEIATQNVGGLNIAYMIPMGLFVAITLGAKVSGACFNPAVTLAVEIAKPQPQWGQAVTLYWVPQLIGACLAQFVARMLIADGKLSGVWLQPQVIFGSDRYSTIQVLFVETWGTFLFTMTILSVCGARSTNCGLNAGYAQFSLCSALVLAIFVAGPISGGGMNPAVAFGLNLMYSITPSLKVAAGAPYTPLGVLWAYLVGPLLGATISGLLYKKHTETACGVVHEAENLLNQGKNSLIELGDSIEHKIKTEFH